MRSTFVPLAALSVFLLPTLAPAQDAPRDYPICTHPGQDSCQNPGEGGAPGHSRASDYRGGPAAYGGMTMSHHHMVHHARHHHVMKKHRHHRH